MTDFNPTTNDTHADTVAQTATATATTFSGATGSRSTATADRPASMNGADIPGVGFTLPVNNCE